jgi:tetratricopeptide (TPR) repeat protein
MRAALRRIAWLAFPVIAGLTAYLPCLRGAFVWDDPIILYRLMSRISTIHDIFLPPRLLIPAPFYKPIAGLMFWIDFRLYGMNSGAWHADGLILHLVTVVAVFHLVRRWLGGAPGWEKPALAGASLFAVWPACTEPLGWIAARSELVMGACLVPALCLHLDARDRGRSALPAALLFLIALGAKETTIAFLAAVFVASVLLPPGPGATHTGRKALFASALWLPYVLAYVLYAAVRRSVLGPSASLGKVGASKLAAVDPVMVFKAWGFYVRETLLLGHGAPYVETPPGGLSTYLLATLGAAAILIAAGVGFRFLVRVVRTAGPGPIPGAAEGLAACCAWFLLFVGPPLSLASAPISIALVAMRYLYVPCIAVAPAIGLAVARLPPRLTGRLGAAALFLAVCSCGIAVGHRLAPWRTEISLWTRARADQHLSLLANENLAIASEGAGDVDVAEDLFRIACYVSPARFETQRQQSCYRLMELYILERKLTQARRTAVYTAELYPGDEEGTAQLMSAASVLGVLEKAQSLPNGVRVPRDALEREVPVLERAAKLDPLDQGSRMILAQYYRALGEAVRARRCYLELAELAVVDPVLHAGAMRSADELQVEIDGEKDPVKKLYFRAQQAEFDGRTVDAIEAWKAALAIAPDRSDLLIPLAADLSAEGRTPEAVEVMRAASRANPDSATVWFDLGLYLGASKDFRAAADAMERAGQLRPNWPQAHLHHAMALDALGDADGAIAEYRLFLSQYYEEQQTRVSVQKRIDVLQSRPRAP